jgi:hypothetical protein
MTQRTLARWTSLVVLAAVSACGHDSTAPSTNPPARLDAASDVSRSGQVGSALGEPLVVRVRDSGGRGVIGATVTFAVTQGNGSVSPRVATTDASGDAKATWTLGTLVGANEVTSAVTGVATPIKFTATGTPGPVASVTVTPQNLRLLVGSDSSRLASSSLDAFGNVASPSPTLVSRDPTLITVAANGVVRALRRGASTYVVATAGGRSDSALVTVLAPGQSLCTGVATPVSLSVGQVLTGFSSSGLCIHSAAAGEEYTLIPYYNSSVPSATAQIEVRGQGIAPLVVASAAPAMRAPAGPVPDESFELALRERERRLISAHAAEARAWYTSRSLSQGALRSVSVQPPAVGDLLRLNANAISDCDDADLRTGRVVAVSDKAIVVADTSNPPGGFTAEEYQGFGITFDTLVSPVDEGAFGKPADIDNNARVVMFFTRAVNELTPRGSSAFYLGFFYGRDLLPKTSCAGSNVAEMFYLLVPDTGAVAGDVRTKSVVTSNTVGTVAHEYQHLINASRRLYVNTGAVSQEELWLNEGLSHIAEELVFYRSAGLPPRTNLDATIVGSTPTGAAFSTFQQNNIRRFRQYLLSPESRTPIGGDGNDLATRGAAWSFLRYAADRVAPSTESNLWFQLANGKQAGLANLAAALGTDPSPLVRDWAISVFADDNVPGLDARYKQPSWNLRSLMPATGLSYALFTRQLIDGSSSVATITGGSASFMRFSVQGGQDALLTITSLGQPLPASMQLAVIRVK